MWFAASADETDSLCAGPSSAANDVTEARKRKADTRAKIPRIGDSMVF
jgi:hypothetical protein